MQSRLQTFARLLKRRATGYEGRLRGLNEPAQADFAHAPTIPALNNYWDVEASYSGVGQLCDYISAQQASVAALHRVGQAVLERSSASPWPGHCATIFRGIRRGRKSPRRGRRGLALGTPAGVSRP